MKKHQFLVFLFFIAWAAVLIPMQIELAKLQKKVQSNQVEIDDLKMHSKTPCMTVPDDAACALKTGHVTLPGGSKQKALMQYCWWYADGFAQKWLDEK